TLRNFHSGMVNATRAVGNFASGVARHIKNVLGWFRDLPGRIRNALGDVGSWLYNAGKDLIQGFINGIGSMFGSVKNKLGDLTSNLTSWKGPPKKDAKLLFGAGRLIIQGLNDGFDASVPDVRRTLQGITHEIE